ncbi:MAG: galactokinase family protein [Clostridia bacterium]|nr:galactokinase family protein [Clostridia bacterium]
MNSIQITELIENGAFDKAFERLYADTSTARSRYINAVFNFSKIYGDRDNIRIFSVPGRTEVSGNHTDHNNGKVLAASVDLDIIAVAAENSGNEIRIKSHGFDMDTVDISNLSRGAYPKFSSAALIAGMCDGFLNRGYCVGGFDAYTTSDVIKGSGLSSSAAFEVMVGNILNCMFNGGTISAPTIAMIAQYAENEFFGKPCGLMDQCACAVGGFVYIDFENPRLPKIEKLDFDLSKAGFNLCITNTGGSHASLNDDYASIPLEMKSVAKHFGKEVLREITLENVISDISGLRRECGDRAVLRALHFLDENDRVERQRTALKEGDTDAFFSLVKASGESSKALLQNIYSVKNVNEQGLSVALDISRRSLEGKRGAYRVHGGGFAGTIQAFVLSDDTENYKNNQEAVFGKGQCHVLHIRPYGALEVTVI